MTDADDLYGLPLDEFIGARAALVKELRAAKEREEAAIVAKLPKPSVAAGAVNRLVRGEPDAVRAVFEAGDALAAAQEALLAGTGDAAAMKAATTTERDAVDAAVALAGDLGAATLDKVHATLHAAALDETAREAISGGRLIRELSHAGLGFGISEVTAAVPAPRKPKAEPVEEEAKAPAPRRRKAAKAASAEPKADDDAATERQAEEARRAEAERAAEEARRAKARRAAEEAEAIAATEAGEAAATLAEAGQRREEAAEALETAQTAYEEADAAVEAALTAADAATAALERARAALEEA